jgi:hypothetical protein
MHLSRRDFLKHLGRALPLFVGGTQLAGCLGESGSQPDAMAQPETRAIPATTGAASSPAAGQVAASASAPDGTTKSSANASPVWQPTPTIDFVEGVPATVSIRAFVTDANSDPLVISLNSGALPPGITWNPNTATLAYDGRPLGAREDAPVQVSGVTFVADDQRN